MVFFLLNYGPAATNEYMQAGFDKQMKLLDKKPKMILIGGSNLAFGMDSQQLVDKFGYNVVNMGLHAGLGMEFMLECVKNQTHPGDIVIYLGEYNNYTDMPFYDTDTIYRYVKYYPLALKYVDFNTFGKRFIKEIPAIMRTGMLNLEHYIETKQIVNNGVYDRFGFDKYGDLTSHWDQPSNDIRNYGKLLFSGEKISQEKLDYLNGFAEYEKTRGVIVYVGFPPTPQGQINVNLADKIADRLRESDAFTVIGEPENYVYKYTYFYDTYYHLNYEGGQMRVKQLIQDLEPFITPIN